MTISKLKVKGNLGKTILQLSAQFSDAPSAIWEYVSNSLDYREKPDGCRINVLLEKNRIIIADNSDGMDSMILENFFTISGDNLARKGKQASWLKRGKYGTGKTAAFGIGNILIVETNRDGLKNKYRLSRKAIEESSSDDAAIPLEELITNVKTHDANGTVITIDEINIPLKQDEIVRKIEREISGFRSFDIQIAVNNHICEFRQLEILQTYKFESSGPIKERYGDFELEILVSKTPLDPTERGIKVTSNHTIIGIEDCGISSKEFGNQITGNVDIPDLEKPINNVNSYNQTRNHKLNKNHEGVRELIFFIAPKIEKVRKELSDSKQKEKNSTQARKMSEMTNQLSEKFNKQWNDLRRQLNEIRVSSNSNNVDSIFIQSGENEELEGVVPGEDFTVDELEHRQGESDNNIPPINEPNKEYEKSEDGSSLGSNSGGKKSKRKRGGFIVDHDSLGEDEHRSIYNQDELKIVINTDHPSIKNCLLSCNNDVENISFKRLIFEIAFREFEHAIAQEMIVDNDMYPPSDLLYEMRAHYDKIARLIGSDLYKIY